MRCAQVHDVSGSILRLTNHQVQKGEGSEIDPRQIAEIDSLPEEIRLEVRKDNFVRAAHLAVQSGLAREVIRRLQCSALRQFIEVLHNFEGAKQLIASYDLSADEIREVLQIVMNSEQARTEVVTWFDKKGRTVTTTLAERILRDPMFRKYL